MLNDKSIEMVKMVSNYEDNNNNNKIIKSSSVKNKKKLKAITYVWIAVHISIQLMSFQCMHI